MSITTEKKEICFIAPPPSSSSSEQQQEASTTTESLQGKKVFTSKFPINLCIGCCSAVKSFAEIHESFFAAQIEAEKRRYQEEQEQETKNHDDATNISTISSSIAPSSMNRSRSSTRRKRSQSAKRRRKNVMNANDGENTNEDHQPNPAKAVKKNLAKLRRAQELEDELGGSSDQQINNNNAFSTLPPSFFSELPSVLQMELPSGTDMETLRLYSEFHCGGSYFGNNNNNNNNMQGQQGTGTLNSSENVNIIKKLELNQVENWGTASEKSTSLKEVWANSALMKNPLLKMKNGSSSDAVPPPKPKSSRNKNPVLDFTQDEESVEHGNLSPFAVPDRNPAVLLASCGQYYHQQQNENSNGENGATAARSTSATSNISSSSTTTTRAKHPQISVLPQWEQKWVQENFLSFDSPACCAKAAKVAALAEYLGCIHLVQLCAVVIAARLCERPNASVDHMQWCLMGRSSGLNSATSAME